MTCGDITMKVEADQDGDVIVVVVRGRVSIGHVEELNDFLVDLIDRGHRKFVLDLQGMEHIVSGGIGVFIGFNEKLKKAGGAARLARVHPRVQKIFNMMSLDSFFLIFSEVEQAVKSFESSP